MRAGQDAALYLLRRPARWERRERGERREGDQDQDQEQKGIVKATTRSGGTVRGRTGERKPCRRDGLGTYSTRDGGESEGPWQAVEGAGVVRQTG